MTKSSSRAIEFQMEELADGSGQDGSDSGGQSGDTQGLSPTADESDESVKELAETGQAYEADVVAGVEDAADHPERPVPTRENQARPAGSWPDGDSDQVAPTPPDPS